MTLFNSYRDSIIIKNHITCQHIIVGDYSYYSGYYHGKNFEDCVLYLDKTDDHQGHQDIDQLIIGKFCSIASGVKFMMGGTQGHNQKWISTYPLDFLDNDYDQYQNISPKAQQCKGNTIIGNDVWIGFEALIMPGVTIADGAVIGAGAILTKNVGPYEIWGGNPARLIKKRFSESDIQKLLQIQWWNWEIEILRSNIKYLRSDDVEILWQKYGSKIKKTNTDE
ncbi:MAG: CatB-related O-acetyltransferase [Janthinobacterium lividum]